MDLNKTLQNGYILSYSEDGGYLGVADASGQSIPYISLDESCKNEIRLILIKQTATWFEAPEGDEWPF